MSRPSSLTFLFGALLCAGVATIPEASGHGAHEHGVSHLDVILDGNVLAIDLRGAGHHLVGFEHAPESAGQRAAWQATIDGLRDAQALFVLEPQAGCVLRSAEVVAPSMAAPGQGHGHDHAGHRHDDSHAPSHTGAHGDDWRARYRFECADAPRLAAIEVGLFTAFPAHQEVRYQRLSGEGQDGGTLTPGRTRLPLR